MRHAPREIKSTRNANHVPVPNPTNNRSDVCCPEGAWLSLRSRRGITGHNLVHRFSNLAGITFRSLNNSSSGSPKDELLCARIHEIKDERAFSILLDVDVGSRRAVPHAIVSITV